MPERCNSGWNHAIRPRMSPKRVAGVQPPSDHCAGSAWTDTAGGRRARTAPRRSLWVRLACGRTERSAAVRITPYVASHVAPIRDRPHPGRPVALASPAIGADVGSSAPAPSMTRTAGNTRPPTDGGQLGHALLEVLGLMRSSCATELEVLAARQRHCPVLVADRTDVDRVAAVQHAGRAANRLAIASVSSVGALSEMISSKSANV